MTAPAIIESAPPTDASPSVIDSIVSDAVAATMAESAEADTPRDDQGRFLPKGEKAATPAESAPPSDATQTTAPATTDEPAPVVLPEGMVAVPKIEGRELATPFTVKDKDGDLEVPDLLITFQANGKERVEPIDRVVKLAQMGVYNEEREQQRQQTHAESERVVAENAQWRTYAQQLQQAYDAVLSDDTAYLDARAKYEQENTPEARNARERDQLDEQRQQNQFTAAAQDGTRFYEATIVPAVETILKALPTVTETEIGARLLLITNRFQVHTRFGSIIPPAQYAAVKQAIMADVVPWAQQLHEHRQHERASTTQQSEAENLALRKAAEKAQTDAQKSKSLLTRTAKPGPGRGAAKETPPPKKLVSVDDFEQDALSATLDAMRQAG